MNKPNKLHTALITGSSSGIGLELTRSLLAEGWQVIGLNRSPFPAEQDDIQRALRSGQLQLVQANLTNYESLKIALDQIKLQLDTIDVLFNNAGAVRQSFVFLTKGMKCTLNFKPSFLISFIWSYMTLYAGAPSRPLLILQQVHSVWSDSSTWTFWNVRLNSRSCLVHMPPRSLASPYGHARRLRRRSPMAFVF